MTKTFFSRGASFALTAAAVLLLGGCATSGNPKDPIEGFNRAMFGFNEGLDKAVIKPVAQGYEAALPMPVRSGVSNFFGNIADVLISLNNLLQGKPADAASDFGRFAVNSTFGILGLFDVASDMGMEKHDEDFGQTFGRWGVGDGAYVVLPVLGPRTARDTVLLIFDIEADPIVNVEPIATRNVLVATRLVNERATLLPTDKVIEEAALDKYSYVRDAYLQRRRFKIYDGNPPRQSESDAMGEPSAGAAEQSAGAAASPAPPAAAQQVPPNRNGQ